MEGPPAEIADAPTALEVALLVSAVALTLAPGVVPAELTDALAGPAVTLVETPRALPPACAMTQGGVGQLRTVALDGDVQIILQRQRDRVLQGKVEIAGAQQALDAGGIRQIVRRVSPRDGMGR